MLAPAPAPSIAPAAQAAVVVAFYYVDEARILPICLCSICDEPFIDPLEVPSCQHTFCAKCINAWARDSGCPVCRAAMPSSTVPIPASTDKTLLRLLNDLPVYCANKAPDGGGGCAWTGPRGNGGAGNGGVKSASAPPPLAAARGLAAQRPSSSTFAPFASMRTSLVLTHPNAALSASVASSHQITFPPAPSRCASLKTPSGAPWRSFASGSIPRKSRWCASTWADVSL